MEIIGKLVFPFKITISSISQHDLWSLHVFHNCTGDKKLIILSVPVWKKNSRKFCLCYIGNHSHCVRFPTLLAFIVFLFIHVFDRLVSHFWC